MLSGMDPGGGLWGLETPLPNCAYSKQALQIIILIDTKIIINLLYVLQVPELARLCLGIHINSS